MDCSCCLPYTWLPVSQQWNWWAQRYHDWNHKGDNKLKTKVEKWESVHLTESGHVFPKESRWQVHRQTSEIIASWSLCNTLITAVCSLIEGLTKARPASSRATALGLVRGAPAPLALDSGRSADRGLRLVGKFWVHFQTKPERDRDSKLNTVKGMFCDYRRWNVSWCKVREAWKTAYLPIHPCLFASAVFSLCAITEQPRYHFMYHNVIFLRYFVFHAAYTAVSFIC